MFHTALGLKLCKCGHAYTKMFDLVANEAKWIEGNFFEDPNSIIFIIANGADAFMKTYNQIKEIFTDPIITQRVSGPLDIDVMTQYRKPRFILAEDWYETDILTDPRVRRLFSTGHW